MDFRCCRNKKGLSDSSNYPAYLKIKFLSDIPEYGRPFVNNFFGSN